MQRTLRRARRRVGATAFTLAATASLALTTATAPASAATPVLPNPGSVIGDPWELQTVMRAAAAVVDHSAPGMSIAIVKPDPHQPGESITTTYYFGLADKENKHKVGPQTQFEIASETKTFTGALLAKRIYRGLAELDDPAQDYEQNVTFPTMDGSAITLGDLVTHRSGLTDDPGNLHAGCPGDDPECVDAKALYNRDPNTGPGPAVLEWSQSGPLEQHRRPRRRRWTDQHRVRHGEMDRRHPRLRRQPARSCAAVDAPSRSGRYTAIRSTCRWAWPGSCTRHRRASRIRPRVQGRRLERQHQRHLPPALRGLGRDRARERQERASRRPGEPDDRSRRTRADA